MPWDVSNVACEVGYDFSKAIPADSGTWVRIDKVRPGAHAIMEKTLSEATLVYRRGEVQTRTTIHWEMIKFNACWLTLVETNLAKGGKALFPRRTVSYQEVSKDEFARAWNQLMPLEITDEWMAAVLEANPIWYEMLRVWVPLWWLREWLPDRLVEEEDEAGQAVARAREEEDLGEGWSESPET